MNNDIQENKNKQADIVKELTNLQKKLNENGQRKIVINKNPINTAIPTGEKEQKINPKASAAPIANAGAATKDVSGVERNEIELEESKINQNVQVAPVSEDVKKEDEESKEERPKIPTYYDLQLAKYKNQIELGKKEWSIPQESVTKSQGFLGAVKGIGRAIASIFSSGSIVKTGEVEKIINKGIENYVRKEAFPDEKAKQQKILKEKEMLEEVAKTCLLCLNEGCNYGLFEKLKNISINLFKKDFSDKNFGEITSQIKVLIDNFNDKHHENKISWSEIIKNLGGDRDYVIDACKNISEKHYLRGVKDASGIFSSALQQEKFEEKLIQLQESIDCVEKATERLTQEAEKIAAKVNALKELKKNGVNVNDKLKKNEDKLKNVPVISGDKSIYDGYLKAKQTKIKEKLADLPKTSSIATQVEEARKLASANKIQPSFKR